MVPVFTPKVPVKFRRSDRILLRSPCHPEMVYDLERGIGRREVGGLRDVDRMRRSRQVKAEPGTDFSSVVPVYPLVLLCNSFFFV